MSLACLKAERYTFEADMCNSNKTTSGIYKYALDNKLDSSEYE